MQTFIQIRCPDLEAKTKCEAILRSLPEFFGIEEAGSRADGLVQRLTTLRDAAKTLPRWSRPLAPRGG